MSSRVALLVMFTSCLPPFSTLAQKTECADELRRLDSDVEAAIPNLFTPAAH